MQQIRKYDTISKLSNSIYDLSKISEEEFWKLISPTIDDPNVLYDGDLKGAFGDPAFIENVNEKR